MSSHLLQIDISNSKYKREEDLINIKIGNGDFFEVNFSKLVHESKYIRDKYKYCEAVKILPIEIEHLKREMCIKDESLKYFLQLIQNEESKLPIENYKDVYTLSAYFNIETLIDELDRISNDELFKDITFSSQLLLDYQPGTDGYESIFCHKVEIFLSSRVNECMKNGKFKELPVCTIFRILDQSRKETINQELLIDFIFESVKTRFVLLKFSELCKLSNNKLSEIIEIIEQTSEETRKMCYDFLPLSLSLIKKMMEENSLHFNENERLKEEKYERKEENERLKEEIAKFKFENERMKREFEECKNEINRAKLVSDSTRIENKQHTKSIIVGGHHSSNQFGQNSNNKASNGCSIISPPLNLNLPVDPSSFLSFSVYYGLSVLVTNEGSLKGSGYNNDGRISASLGKMTFSHFTDFCINDGIGRQLVAVSAVCTAFGTLYMFRKSDSNGRQLVLCDNNINGGTPIFLDIGNHESVSLFGGFESAAAIGSEGEVIFINRYSIKNSPSSRIEAVSLPDCEKASSVACCDDSVFVLSSKGRVFESGVKKYVQGISLKFSAVSELAGKEIVWLSGTHSHCLAVSKEGRVFGRGYNKSGQLGLGRGTESSPTFTEISSLFGYEIRAAYAGNCHSLFETREGKILACGDNYYGELLLSSGPSSECVYSPTETTITSGSAFCIAGNYISCVFIGDSPPPNTPNMRIYDYK